MKLLRVISAVAVTAASFIVLMAASALAGYRKGTVYRLRRRFTSTMRGPANAR
jgi:hypothetical protein